MHVMITSCIKTSVAAESAKCLTEKEMFLMLLQYSLLLGFTSNNDPLRGWVNVFSKVWEVSQQWVRKLFDQFVEQKFSTEQNDKVHTVFNSPSQCKQTFTGLHINKKNRVQQFWHAPN